MLRLADISTMGEMYVHHVELFSEGNLEEKTSFLTQIYLEF